MSATSSVEHAGYRTGVPWGDVLLSAIASVSWALIGMAGTAALGLHLLQADATASLGPMTAAVVALGAGGSVTPSGDVSAFGLTGAQAHTAVTITPLGVSLVGALLLSWFFLRSLRAAGAVIAPSELLARAGAVVALFVATLGGLAWAGHDVITIDGGSLGLDKLPGAGGGGGGVKIPGLGDLGDISGLLPDNIGNLIHAKAAVGFTVDTAPTLLGGLGWSAGILLIALLASRRTPLPRGWEAVHRVVRPAASALVTVMLVAVAAGLAAAVYAAIGDAHPRRIFGAALLGAPNGTWLGIPIGLFVPFDGKATGELAKLLPDPLDKLLTAKTDQSVTLGRLADLDGRVWLLGVAAAVMMLLAGVLTAVRTPVGSGRAGADWAQGASRGPGAGAVAGWTPGASGGGGSAGVRGAGALGFAGRCALRLGVATALTLPLLAWLTEVSVDASLSVLGFDAFGAGIHLKGNLGMALLLGAVWGAGAGAAGALLAWATGAAGRRAAPLAVGAPGAGAGAPTGQPQYARERGAYAGGSAPYAGGAGGVGSGGAGTSGPYAGGASRQTSGPHAGGASGGTSGPYAGGAGAGASGPHAGGAGAGTTGPYAEGASGHTSGPHAGDASGGTSGPYAGGASRPTSGPHAGGAGAGTSGPYAGGAGAGASGPHGAGAGGGASGPYTPAAPYRPPNPATNPYLRLPDGVREPEDAEVADSPPDETPDVYGAPTVARPYDGPPPRSTGPGSGNRPRTPRKQPPPPTPPPPPRRPKGDR
ncbi:streptophobe family protein [Streptomyces sp. 7R007]